MSAATSDIRTNQLGVLESVPALYSIPMAASTTIYAGTIVATNASGYAVPATASSAYRVWGRAEEQVINSGSAGAKFILVRRGVFYLTNGAGSNAFARADVGSNVYMSDDNIAQKTDGNGLYAFAGVMMPGGGTDNLGTGADLGKVAVMPGVPSMYQASAVQGLALTAQFKARNVATNIAALTFTAGTFEADANGALGAQDGITNAVGDTIIFPAGTITTGVVSAANAGPWVLTAIGAGGAKFAGVRPSWWPHGGTMSAEPVRVTAGTLYAGTTWKNYADTLTTALVIGTGDGKFMPERLTQQVTLSSGTITISNFPVFLAAKLGFSCTGAIGGTAAATTTNFAISATSGITAGGIGTAAVIVEAQSVSDTIVNTDASVINVTLSNN